MFLEEGQYRLLRSTVVHAWPQDQPSSPSHLSSDRDIPESCLYGTKKLESQRLVTVNCLWVEMAHDGEFGKASVTWRWQGTTEGSEHAIPAPLVSRRSGQHSRLCWAGWTRDRESLRDKAEQLKVWSISLTHSPKPP